MNKITLENLLKALSLILDLDSHVILFVNDNVESSEIPLSLPEKLKVVFNLNELKKEILNFILKECKTSLN